VKAAGLCFAWSVPVAARLEVRGQMLSPALVGAVGGGEGTGCSSLWINSPSPVVQLVKFVSVLAPERMTCTRWCPGAVDGDARGRNGRQVWFVISPAARLAQLSPMLMGFLLPGPALGRPGVSARRLSSRRRESLEARTDGDPGSPPSDHALELGPSTHRARGRD